MSDPEGLTPEQETRLRELLDVAAEAERRGFTALGVQATREIRSLTGALLAELDRLRREQYAPCPGGCGCRTEDDPDRNECACAGPCCLSEDWPSTLAAELDRLRDAQAMFKSERMDLRWLVGHLARVAPDSLMLPPRMAHYVLGCMDDYDPGRYTVAPFDRAQGEATDA